MVIIKHAHENEDLILFLSFVTRCYLPSISERKWRIWRGDSNPYITRGLFYIIPRLRSDRSVFYIEPGIGDGAIVLVSALSCLSGKWTQFTCGVKILGPARENIDCDRRKPVIDLGIVLSRCRQGAISQELARRGGGGDKRGQVGPHWLNFNITGDSRIAP